MDLDRIFRTLPNFQNLTPRNLDTSLEIIRNNSIETRFVRTRGVRGGRGARIRKINHPVRFDRILTPSWRERERERGRRGGRGGRVRFLCRRAPIILPLLSRPWPSKWPCNVTVNSITIGRAAQVTETGSAREKGERERER